jgi:hypothetical protein
MSFAVKSWGSECVITRGPPMTDAFADCTRVSLASSRSWINANQMCEDKWSIRDSTIATS